jgi:CHAT domain
MGTSHRCILAMCVFLGTLLGPIMAGGQTPGPFESLSPTPEHDVADCVDVPNEQKSSLRSMRAYSYFHSTNDSPSAPGYESFLYKRAIPNILREHSRFEFFMYWKHIYGMNYGDPPPPNNPMRATEEELDSSLNSTLSEEQPAAILVYWRSEQKNLCAGLVLAGKLMLVEVSSLHSSKETGELLNFSSHLNTRVAEPRSGQGRDGDTSATNVPAESVKMIDLTALSAALLPRTIRTKLASGSVKSLLIVPIENIGEVPFSALPISNANGPLIDFTTITISPGFHTFRPEYILPSTLNRANRKMLIVGDPDLSRDPNWIFPPIPGARREATDVAHLLHGSPLLGVSASHAAVIAALSQPTKLGVIYFATHAITDPKNPQDGSFLALTGKDLYTREVEKLKLKGNPIVVLSACQTGLGKVFDAGGVFGMALAWHYAGAETVVTSLWNVNDGATHDLMVNFMEKLQMLPAARAMAVAMREQRLEHPNFLDWAGFSVYGGLPQRTSTADIRPTGNRSKNSQPTSAPDENKAVENQDYLLSTRKHPNIPPVAIRDCLFQMAGITDEIAAMDQLDKDMLYMRAASEIPSEFAEDYASRLSANKRMKLQTIIKSGDACNEP